MTGPLALIGGTEWTDGCDFDETLLARSGGTEVTMLPAAAAFENPDKCIETATEWFAGLGGTVRGLRVLQRDDALDPANADAVRAASFIYLSGGSPLHLRSVLKETPLWDAIRDAWIGGAVVAGASAGAMVLCDPMVDPRGGAFTVGLGMIPNLSVLPHAEPDVASHHKRTFELADPGLVLAAVPECTALVRDPSGEWRSAGAGIVTVWVDGEQRGFAALPQVLDLPEELA
jgi:cyanophycinase